MWLGWQFDTRDEPGRLRLHAPVAAGVRGLVRSDFVVPERVGFQALGHVIVGRIGGKEYPVADPGSAHNLLTVRDRPNDARQTIPRDAWTWVEDGGTITGIEYSPGFEPGRIYELIYEAADPTLVGLGLAAVRDFAAYAKHDAETVAPVERAIAFGISQSGRFLRHLLYQGFNADEAGRPAFDGVMAHVAGAGRGSFNHRFAQPSRDGQPMEAIHYPTDLYPFTDLPAVDPVTIRVEGLLDRASRDGVLPKIFHTNTSYEYWGRAGSLIHTSPDGKLDVKLPDNVRIYHLAGVQHFQRPLPPSRLPVQHILARHTMNPNPSAFTLRALVVAMQDWVAGRATPPPSRYPRLDEGTLVPLDVVKKKFPTLPDVDLPRDVHTAYRMDYGPEWWDKGIISEHPPKIGEPFPIFVPDVDSDGNDRGGVRIPQLAVPVATYTAWESARSFDRRAHRKGQFSRLLLPVPQDRRTASGSGRSPPAIGRALRFLRGLPRPLHRGGYGADQQRFSAAGGSRRRHRPRSRRVALRAGRRREMIDPGSSTWPLVRAAVLGLLGLGVTLLRSHIADGARRDIRNRATFTQPGPAVPAPRAGRRGDLPQQCLLVAAGHESSEDLALARKPGSPGAFRSTGIYPRRGSEQRPYPGATPR